jgi:hypothetical protein
VDGLSQEVLSFLIDIQQHGASQLKTLSTDFTQLGVTADRIAGQLRTMEAQLAKTGAAADTAGARVASSQKGAAEALDASASAAERSATAQRGNATASQESASATEKATGSTRAHTAAAKADESATSAQAGASRASAGAAGAAGAALGKHTHQLSEHGKALEKVKKGTHEFAGSMNMVSLPLLAVGGLSIKMSMDFEAAMSRLHTQAGYGMKDVKMLEGTVLKAAPAMRRTPTELADGLYHVASVGVPAAAAMKVLEAASIGANIGASDFDTTVNGLVIVMKSLHQPASAAIGDMGLLNEIVGGGNVHMEELVASLGKVLPQAQNFGLGLRDVGAALDVMTGRGINANMAATRLGMSFHLLASPTSAGRAAFETIGLSASDLAEKLRHGGIVPAIEELKKHLDDTFPAHGGKPLGLAERRHELEIYTKALKETGVSGKALEKDQKQYAEVLAHGGSAAVEQARVLSEAFGGGRQSTGILTLTQNLGDLRKAYSRLPEGEQAIHRLMGANEVWEKTSMAHYDHVKASFSAAMTSLGQSVGPPVLGVLTTLAEDTQHVAERFEALPSSTKHLIELFAGVVAVAGPVASMMSKLAGAALLIEKLKTHGSGGAGSPVGGGTGGVPDVLSSIQGFNGPEAPGSKINPIAVMVMDPSGATPLGAPGSAAKTAEKDALKTAGGDAVPLAEGAAGAGAISLASKARELLGRGLKGGMIALGGNAVANIAGTVVGGKTGHAISTIGGDAATGAGVGSLIGPEGTLAGAAVGALVGGIKVATEKPSFGQQIAEHLGKGMTPAAQKAIKDSFDAQHNYEQQRRGGATSTGAGGRGRGPMVKPRVTISNAEAYAGGSAIAASIEHKAAGFKVPDLKKITGEMDKLLGEVPARSRSAGIKSIVAWTAGMESQGKLPKGATENMIANIEKKWPEYASYLRRVGMSSTKELAKTIENKEVTEAAKKTVEEASHTFQGLGPLLAKDGGTVQGAWHTTLAYLEKETRSKMPAVRQAAEHELDAMKKNTKGLMSAWTTELAQHFQQAGLKGATEYGKGMTALVASIRSAMHHGLVSTEEGDTLITRAMTKELVTLAGSTASAAASGIHNLFATGGRVPGAGLFDTVPVLGRHGGVRGVVAPGELLVANRHTEARIDTMLAPYGTSLGHEVTGETRPHSAPMYATGGKLSHYDRLVGAINRVSSANMPYRLGGGHEQPAHFEPFDCSGFVSYAVQQAGYKVPTTTSGNMGGWGFPSGPGQVTIFYNPTHTFMRVGEAYAGTSGFARSKDNGGAGWFDQTPDSSYLAHFNQIHLPDPGADTTGIGFDSLKVPPWKGPGGLLGKAGRAALRKATAAANRRLARAAAAGMGGAGGTGQPLKDGAIVTASEFGGHNDPSAFQHSTASGAIANDSLMGFAELSNPPGSLNFSALGGLPMGTRIKVGYNGRTIEVPKVDVGAGGSGLDGHVRAIDLTYGAARALGAPGLENVSWAKAALGARFAGAFAKGGSVTANQPTLALFGENGPETAHFVPHAATSGEIGEGIIEEAPGKPEKATEAYNPQTDTIETHTAAQWRRIRAQNAKAAHDKAKRHGGAHIDPVTLGGISAGTISDSKFAGSIDIEKDAGKLSAALWKKVIAAISKVIGESDAGAGVATRLAGAAAREAQRQHGTHTHDLAKASITAAGKTVMAVLKKAPEEQAGAAGNEALGQLQKLIHDAKISNNKLLVSGLRKDVETTLKTTGSRFLKLSEAVPPGQAGTAAAQALSKLSGLIGKANQQGLHAIELSLEKSAQKAIANWSGAIQSTLSKATSGAQVRANLRVNLANQRLLNINPAAKLGSATADPKLAQEQAAAAAAAIAEMGKEAHRLNDLIKKTEAREQALLRKASRAHSKHAKDRLHKMAKQVRDEAQELKAQLEEVAISQAEAQSNAAQADIEYKQAVAEALKQEEEAREDAANKLKETLLNTIQAATEGYEHISSHLQSVASLAEGKLHREGKDFSGLEEKKSEQEGVLNPEQIAQAQSDLAAFTAARQQQIASDQAQMAYDQSQLGGLSGPDRTNMENAIDGLAGAINDLESEIYDQTKATKKLTEATEAQTKAYGGTVGFEFQGQQYIAGGQSSNSGANIMTGV